MGLAAAFGALAAASGRRGTHGRGVAATGTCVVDPDPALPRSAFFAPGRVFPARVRHATLGRADDAARDVRGFALALSDQDDDSPLDLALNSGDATPFRDAPSLLGFLAASARGPGAFARWAGRNPWAVGPAARGAHRAPESFLSVEYAAGVTLRWRPLDGVTRLVRLRVRPDGSRPLPPDPGDPWDQDRAPEEVRPVDYLRREYLARLARGPVRYALELQVRPYTDEPGPYDVATPWDPARWPWRALARIELVRPLDHPTTERLVFRPDRLPDELAVPPAPGLRDPRAIAALRGRLYRGSRLGRTLASRVRRSPHPRAREPGDRADRVCVAGRLIHDSADEAPLHHLAVELWDAKARHAPIATATTDRDGRFDLSFDLVLGGPEDGPDLRLVVLDPLGGDPLLRLDGPHDFHGPRFDFGGVRVAWFEYDHTMGLPRADRTRPLPQAFSRRYWPVLLRDNLRHVVTNRLHCAILRVDDGLLSIDAIQRAYPETRTLRDERRAPGSTRSDRYLGERVLNGLNPWNFRVFPDGGYRFQVDWTDAESTGVHDLVNVLARFEVEQEHLVPRWIELSWRLPGHTAPGSPMTEPRRFSPADGPDWDAAKRVLRVQYSIAGELDTHLCQAHLNVEQYAMAALRNLRRNPVREVLLPHLREVTAINRRGDHAVFGPQGVIPTSSALTTSSAVARMRRQLGRLDWTCFRPRRPLCATHTYAKVANLYWDALCQHLREFFAARAEEIADQWLEVRRFSDDLVAHAVPWVPLPDRESHADRSEIDDPRIPRVTRDGVVRAVRPVTGSDEPAPGDLERLEQLCRYVVFHATLFHTWENDAQRDDGGDLRWATLGLRNGSLGFDTDATLLPRARQATDQLYFAHTLASRTPGILVENEDGDVHPRLVGLLLERREAFAALGWPVERIRSRVNI